MTFPLASRKYRSCSSSFFSKQFSSQLRKHLRTIVSNVRAVWSQLVRSGSLARENATPLLSFLPLQLNFLFVRHLPSTQKILFRVGIFLPLWIRFFLKTLVSLCQLASHSNTSFKNLLYLCINKPSQQEMHFARIGAALVDDARYLIVVNIGGVGEQMCGVFVRLGFQMAANVIGAVGVEIVPVSCVQSCVSDFALHSRGLHSERCICVEGHWQESPVCHREGEGVQSLCRGRPRAETGRLCGICWQDSWRGAECSSASPLLRWWL